MIGTILAAAVIAAVSAYMLTPAAKWGAVRAGIMAQPGARRIHQALIPQGAGVAIYAAFWLTVLAMRTHLPQWISLNLGSTFLGSTMIVALGLLDDKFELRPAIKFAGQLAAVVYTVMHGHRIDFITNPLVGDMQYVGALGIPLTVFWIIAVINMVNFTDGVDGLAAGVSGIACIPLAITALQVGRPGIALLTLILAGSILGFLPYNLNPAKVFMGDTGAMFLGFMLGVITVDGALKGAAAIALTVPFLALGVPAFDTVFAVIRRIGSGRPFYEADQGHLHHRLLALGYSQRRTTFTLYAVSAILGVAAVSALNLPEWQGTLLFVAVAALACLGARTVGVLPAHRRHTRFLHR